MKKLIAALTLVLAFSINANAQDKKTSTSSTSYDLGKKQAVELVEFLAIDKDQTENFARLFEQKIDMMDNPNLNQERRDELSRVIEAKIRATLDEKQMQRLEKNADLFKRLTH